MKAEPYDPTRPETPAVIKALEAGDIESLKLALTPRQRRFAEEYNLDFNGAAAATRAGYAPKYADRQAHQLVKHRGVAAYIDHLGQSKQAAIFSVSPEYVIQQILEIVNKPGSKDSDKLRGIEMIAKHLGMFIDRTEISGRDGEAIEVRNQQVAEEASNFAGLIGAMVKKKEVHID